MEQRGDSVGGGRSAVTRRALLTAGVGVLGASVVDASAAEAAPDRSATAPRLFVLGDSWAAGLYADPERALGQTAARLLGWPADVDAVSGTGYLMEVDGGARYPTRLRQRGVDRSHGVAVVQGGSNDVGRSLADLRGAVGSTVRLLAARHPHQRILLLGPGPDPEPVTAAQRAVDDLLADAAKRLHVPYVSMLRQHWIAAGRTDLLDAENHHPTAAGQRYLGRRLAESIRRRFPDLAR